MVLKKFRIDLISLIQITMFALTKRFFGPSHSNDYVFLGVFSPLWFLYILHSSLSPIKAVAGQAVIPLLPQDPRLFGNSSGAFLRSFLEPCTILTVETHCTEEEYENNEDCLPLKKDNCDQSKKLFCLSGLCLPNCHPHKETYDPINGKCFRKVGSDCKSAINATITTTNGSPSEEITSSSSHLSPESNQGEPLSTVIVPPCEPSAVCESGQCRCAKDFTYDHFFNKCVLYAPFAGYCNETVNCDRKSDIECRENECQCKSPEVQYFHSTRKRCYILVGQVCSSTLQFCPDNSNCVRAKPKGDIEEGDKIELISASKENGTSIDYRLRQLYQESLVNHNDEEEDEHFIGILGVDEENEFVCKCDKGYGTTRDKRFCLGLHGARCNTLHRCNAERGLKCYEGTCVCNREKDNEQVYSEQFQTCITLVGAPCLSDGKGERREDICPIGATCQDEKCVCNEGLTPSTLFEETISPVTLSCFKSHGMPCTPENTSLNLFDIPCNHEVGLICNATEKRCLCENSNQFYDVVQGNCENFITDHAKIPVIHFNTPKDREYTFHTNNGSTKLLKFSRILLLATLKLILLNIISFR